MKFFVTSLIVTSTLHSGAGFTILPTFTFSPLAIDGGKPDSFHKVLAALPSSENVPLLTETDRKKQQSSSSVLTAVAIGTSSSRPDHNDESLRKLWRDTIQPVLSASLLVTGSTIGATCLVLPETVAGPGLLSSIPLFLGAFGMNLLSGLAISEVAIKQHEASGNQVPSSFKEFADVNLQSKAAGNTISAISMFVNCCVVSFDLTRAGTVGASLLDRDSPTMSICFAAIVASLVASLSPKQLSSIASLAVLTLFVSFAGLLLPGMAHVVDPIGTVLTPGIAVDSNQAILHAAPIILLTMVYQNIVPTVTKILNYDRSKTTAALSLGSFLPLLMYLVWCFTVLGGGIDSSSLGGPFLTTFSIAAVSGSALGCTMSIAEEMNSYLRTDKTDATQPQTSKKKSSAASSQVFSLPSVIAAVGLPLTAGLFLSGGKDFGSALSAAGAYGDPLLYGAIPVAMAWTQRQRFPEMTNLVPGGAASLGLLGVGSAAFLCEELFKDLSHAVGL